MRGMLSRNCFFVNCDGIVNIKAARCWRLNSAPLVPPPLIPSEQTPPASKRSSMEPRSASSNFMSQKRSTPQHDKDIQPSELSSHESSSVESTVESRTKSFPGTINDSQDIITQAILETEKAPTLVCETSHNARVKKNHSRKKQEKAVSSSMEEGCSSSLLTKSLSRTQRKYTDTTPSKFCHVCQKLQADKMHVVCENMQAGRCRKVVCKKCCTTFGWDWKEITAPDARWCCPHCTNSCPKRAQCYIYEKTNDRRRLGIMKKRRVPRK